MWVINNNHVVGGKKMTTWISIGKVARLFGVSTQTIRNWTDQGQFRVSRTLGKHRRYSKDEIDEKLGNEKTDQKLTICYSRVSANDQKKDLERQRQELQEYCTTEKYKNVVEIKETGSGLNYKKRGFVKLIRLMLSGNVKRVVVSYQDRLIRFGREIIEEICFAKGISLVVVNQSHKKCFEEQLSQDIISILTVFCSKIYGRRSHERRKKRKNAGNNSDKIE